MFLAFDTHYTEPDQAKTVCLAFQNWTDSQASAIFSQIRSNIAPYQPGAFYLRELPCILGLLQEIDIQDVKAIIVDGYVFLDDQKTLGLGGHLYQSLDGKIPIIGIAKSAFAKVQTQQRLVFRGQSKKPLYLSCLGLDLDQTAQAVQSMTGPHRLPDLLKTLDRLTKTKD